GTIETRLYEYALDILPRAERAEIEAALDRDSSLRDELKAILESLVTLSHVNEPMSAGDRSREAELREPIVNSLTPAGRYAGFARRLGRLFDLSLSEITRILAQIDAAPAPPWRALPLSGCLMLPVRGGARLQGAHCALIYVERGANVPPHEHDAEEHMLILDGYAAEITDPDAAARQVGPGDEVISAADSRHGFDILVDQPCVFAVITRDEASHD
ncbi:MAG: hypothetical protein ACR2RL_20770, partial [Gammaproteobacteria bacterium]